MKKIFIIAGLTVFLTAFLTGCFFKSVDELYALPQQSQEYYDLQSEIDKLMTTGVSYAAPISGANQQSVQLADLDGDNQDEVIVFLKATGEKPLRMHIFDRVDGSFDNIATVTGDGNTFESVEYLQMDGHPGLEIVLGRQVSEQVLQSMTVLSLEDGNAVELLNANYSEYKMAELNGDGNQDLFVLRFDAEERVGVAEYYHYDGSQMVRAPESLLSAGVSTVKRIMFGNVATGLPAVFVAGLYEETSTITDVFVYENESFVNLTTNGAVGTGAQAIQNYFVYATDIDGDGIIELPQPRQLPAVGESEGQESQYLINWYGIYPVEEPTRKLMTYHNYQSGWYLELPQEWDGNVTVGRTEAVGSVRGYVFYQWMGKNKEPIPIFTIYPYTGENSLGKMLEDGCSYVGTIGETAYGAELGPAPFAWELNGETLADMFHIIHVDWNSGET